LEQKRVAGFNAVVLEADSSGALAGWLNQHGYELSPAVADWAAPYVAARWKFTALRVAENPPGSDAHSADPASAPSSHAVHAAALHMTFKTDRPLFPYREPRSAEAASTLGASDRLLRVYFISDARYEGNLSPEVAWTGRAVWADKLDEQQRARLLTSLKLASADVPARMFLTEFEDHWQYRQAPADLYFSPEPSQKRFQRPAVSALPNPGSFDVATLGFCGLAMVRTIVSRVGGPAKLRRFSRHFSPIPASNVP
jgi:hypothetical protein